MDSFRRLANGANAAYYEQTALSYSNVVAAQVTPRSRGVGTVDVTVATQAGVPEQTLLDEIQEQLQSMREIAVDVQVLPPETVSVDVTVSVETAAGYDTDTVCAQVEETVRSWFTGERLGQNVLRAQLSALVFALDGVANCQIVQPEQDVTVTSVQLPVLGVCSVEPTE
jgi:uncharacterized phage protein gp47/JayE